MGQIAEFLVQKKFEKAKDHQDEVKELEDEVTASWDRYKTNIYTALPHLPQHLKQLQDAPTCSRFSVSEIAVRTETRHLIT